MIRYRTSLAGVLTVVAAACSPADAGPDHAVRVVNGLRAAVQVKGAAPAARRLADRMQHFHVPGVSVAVVDSGRVVWARGFGVKEAGGADSVTEGTLFQAASISKPVAATAMLRLVEEGKLSLDENVNTYLTSWKLPENRFTRREPVTLRRIVSHNAGLTVHGFPGYAVTDAIPTVPQVLDGAAPANTAPVRVDTLPGAIFRYSGGGTTIEQLVMTEVTGEPFPAIVKRLVLDPAGMTSSTYEQPLPAGREAEAASAHQVDGSPVPGRWHIYPEMVAAGLWTTPTDLLKWAMAIAASRAGDSAGILSQDMAAAMLTVQKAPVGLGPFLEGSGRGFNFGHGGANEGFRAQVVYFPETGQGAAVMTNGDGGGPLVQEVLFSIAAEYQWPDYGPDEIAAVAQDSMTLARFVGSYEMTAPTAATAHVTREGDHLVVGIAGFASASEVAFVSPTEAVALDNGTRFTFEVGGDGPAAALKVGPYRLTRRP